MTTFSGVGTGLLVGWKAGRRAHTEKRSMAIAAAARKTAGFAQRALTVLLTLAGLGSVAAAAWLVDMRLGLLVAGACSLVLCELIKPDREPRR